MPKHTYKLASDGVQLTHIATGEVIEIDSFAIVVNGKMPVVKITDRRGGQHSIARHKIDETLYSLGAAKPAGSLKKAARGAGGRAGDAQQLVDVVLITRAELLELNEISKRLFDFTHKRLVRLIVPHPDNAGAAVGEE